MNIKLVCIGTLGDSWLKEGAKTYLKRLQFYYNVEVLELKEASSALPTEQIRRRETEQLFSKVQGGDFVVALDVKGKSLDSPQLAAELNSWMERSGGRLCILIGGSHGYERDLLKRADYLLKLSDMTFTHQMSRLILLEQLFRATKIARGEEYHK